MGAAYNYGRQKSHRAAKEKIALKKRSFGTRYLHLTTGKPWFFYSILLLGVTLFLYLTLTTNVQTDAGSQTLFYIIFVRAGKGL